MTDLQSISKIVKDLALDYKLTDVEALTIAVQIQRNQILENGLVVSRSDGTPTGLEALAIALGYKAGPLDSGNIQDSISYIGDVMDEMKDSMKSIKDVIEDIPGLVKEHRQGNWYDS